MPTFTLVEGAGENQDFTRVIIPEDEIVTAEVVSVTQETKPYLDDNGNPVEKLVFSFKITDDRYKGAGRVWGETSMYFQKNPPSKMYAWACELLGQELPAGFNFNTDSVVGQTCRVVMGIRRWKDKNTGEQQERNTAKDVIRSRTMETANTHF